MNIETFYDTRTYTLSYVVWDTDTKDAVVIDPVLDYDPAASKVWTESVDKVIAFVRDNRLTLRLILETHAHADHLSGSQLIKDAFPEAQIAIGKRITEVQSMFKNIYELPEDFPTDGRQFDRLLADKEVVEAGALRIETFNTPGHTPACVTYKIEDALITGDLLFMPDMGTGRCDFPGGSATDMYRSVQERIYSLPDATRIFVGHDYQPGGRELRYETTVGEQKAHNVALPASRSEKDFVQWRNGRDAQLAAPKLLFQSIQVNVDAGALPKPTEQGHRYLKIPINVFRPEHQKDALEYAEVDPQKSVAS